jgi:hypothetical protein
VDPAVSEPTPDQWRAAFASQVCPLCERGPYVKLSTHVTMAHGLPARVLRDLALVTMGYPMAAPEYLEARRRQADAQRFGGIRRRAGSSPVTLAARAKFAATSRAYWSSLTPEQRAARGRAINENMTPAERSERTRKAWHRCERCHRARRMAGYRLCGKCYALTHP